MGLPEMYRAFRRTTGELPLTIAPSIEQLPRELGPTDVLIKVHAVSLNFRDIAVLDGRYPAPALEGGIVASDAAAEVAAIGSAVKDFVIGDRVSVIFNLVGLTGSEDEPYQRMLSSEVDGVLREYAVYEEKYLVHLPKHLSWVEASTITCAGVTAWNALDSLKSAGQARAVLLQGTGGVSLFALLLCLAAGIRPIITSSSDEKLADLQKLSPDVRTINYKTLPDHAAEVQKLSGGKGVDFVIKTTGPGSLPQDIGFLRQRGGVVSIIGLLDGVGGDSLDPSAFVAVMRKTATLKGILVGSKEDYKALNRFLAENKGSLMPLVDRVFTFDESPAAFEYLNSGSHVGKVVIKVQD